jgi:hypothetical protein
MIKNKYEIVSKAEKDRLVGTTLIPSYGKLPVKNENFNKLIQYLEKLNKQLQVPNPSKKQKGLQDAIETQLNIDRLKILDDHLLKSEYISKGDNILAALAFRNWCGIGTPIYTNIQKDIDNPSKMFKIDRICRDHDIRYTKGQTQKDLKEADWIMMKEILEEYVISFKNNFITGDYDADFSTWSSSFKTLWNGVLSFVEAGATLGLIGAGVKTLGEVVSESNKIIPDITNYAKLKYNTLRYFGQRRDIADPFIRRQIENLRPQLNTKASVLAGRIGSSGKSILKDAGKLLMTTIIRDKLAAMVALGGIGLKTAFEYFFNYDIVEPWQHEVSDKQLDEIIRVFELLQNEYLTDSDLEPVKVGNEWTKEELIFPSIETLEKELTEIFIMNKTYINKRLEVVENEPMPPEPSPEEIDLAHDITDMLITDPVSIQKQIEPVEVAEPIATEQSLTEEEEKILKELIELRDYFIKLESEDNYIMTPYPDLPSTEPISDNTNRPIVPDIEKDIKDAKQSSMLDTPEVEDVPIQQNTDTGQDLKPIEIKNKMEL